MSTRCAEPATYGRLPPRSETDAAIDYLRYFPAERPTHFFPDRVEAYDHSDMFRMPAKTPYHMLFRGVLITGLSFLQPAFVFAGGWFLLRPMAIPLMFWVREMYYLGRYTLHMDMRSYRPNPMLDFSPRTLLAWYRPQRYFYYLSLQLRWWYTRGPVFVFGGTIGTFTADVLNHYRPVNDVYPPSKTFFLTGGALACAAVFYRKHFLRSYRRAFWAFSMSLAMVTFALNSSHIQTVPIISPAYAPISLTSIVNTSLPASHVFDFVLAPLVFLGTTIRTAAKLGTATLAYYSERSKGGIPGETTSGDARSRARHPSDRPSDGPNFRSPPPTILDIVSDSRAMTGMENFAGMFAQNESTRSTFDRLHDEILKNQTRSDLRQTLKTFEAEGFTPQQAMEEIVDFETLPSDAIGPTWETLKTSSVLFAARIRRALERPIQWHHRDHATARYADPVTRVRIQNVFGDHAEELYLGTYLVKDPREIIFGDLLQDLSATGPDVRAPMLRPPEAPSRDQQASPGLGTRLKRLLQIDRADHDLARAIARKHRDEAEERSQKRHEEANPIHKPAQPRLEKSRMESPGPFPASLGLPPSGGGGTSADPNTSDSSMAPPVSVPSFLRSPGVVVPRPMSSPPEIPASSWAAMASHQTHLPSAISGETTASASRLLSLRNLHTQDDPPTRPPSTVYKRVSELIAIIRDAAQRISRESALSHVLETNPLARKQREASLQNASERCEPLEPFSDLNARPSDPATFVDAVGGRDFATGPPFRTASLLASWRSRFFEYHNDVHLRADSPARKLLQDFGRYLELGGETGIVQRSKNAYLAWLKQIQEEARARR